MSQFIKNTERPKIKSDGMFTDCYNLPKMATVKIKWKQEKKAKERV